MRLSWAKQKRNKSLQRSLSDAVRLQPAQQQGAALSARPAASLFPVCSSVTGPSGPVRCTSEHQCMLSAQAVLTLLHRCTR